MSTPKTPLELLREALACFEEHSAADRAARKEAVLPLQRLAKKLEIQLLPLEEQRWRLTAAEATGDKETLKSLFEFSQYPEVAEWCAEILNLKQPRTLSCQRIQL